jgi:tRNA modification GTPase
MRPTGRDTIAAIATAPGPGAVAIVRLSGPQAIEIADLVFRGGASLADAPTHTAHLGRAVGSEGAAADEVLATVMRAPSSYTTEDVVEFGCHGGVVAARSVLDACLEAGARPARRGEFTERAFLGGRLDLVQAEAVADIVGARTRRGLAAALGQLDGRLSSRLRRLRERFLSHRADVEALVDLDADDVDPPDVSGVTDGVVALLVELDELLATARRGVAVRDGLSVAIVGRPNVGKSSLLNALLGRDRAIVTDTPGTTRDIIEEVVEMDGIPVRLIDTAGWRDADEQAELEGVMRSRGAAAGADVVLLVYDLCDGWTEQDALIRAELDAERTVRVGNKADLLGKAASAPDGVAVVSALRGDGLNALSGMIVDDAGTDNEGALVTNVRHVDALRRARDSVASSARHLAEDGGAELAAQDLRDASDALDDITGATTPDDVLRTIFERFCVGK